MFYFKSFLWYSAIALKLEPWSCFRRRAEVRHAEIFSARLGSAWHASALDKENIAALKQLYWRYLIKDNFKVKENVNNSLSN